MKSKSIIRIVLLGMVAIAVAAWAVKEFGPAEASAASPFPDGVTVINFHGGKRCRTCVAIGDLARKTLESDFAAEEKAGSLHWRQVNYEEPANARFVNDYALVSSTILVTLRKNGKEVKWNRLDGVWDHVGDEPAFRAYVARGVREMLVQP